MARSPNPSNKNNRGSYFRLGIRLLLLGLGLGVITGSALIAFKNYYSGEPIGIDSLFGLNKKDKKLNKINFESLYQKQKGFKRLSLGRFKQTKELINLSRRWDLMAGRYPDLKVSAYMLILDDGRFAQLNHDLPLPAASSIKIPILLTTLQLIDSGKIRWNELLELTDDDVAGGAGWMALKPLGTIFPVHDVATEMIRISDNTATNLLIKRVGGKDFLNSNFVSLGMKSTRINSLLPDLAGTNLTTAKDLALAIAIVDTGKVLSPRLRDTFREVMSTSVTNRLIPGGLLKGLGVNDEDPDKSLLIRGFRVYNKTGDIGIAYSDAGLIELPDGRRAVAGFIVKGPFNDPRSTELIRDLSASMIPFLSSKDTQ